MWETDPRGGSSHGLSETDLSGGFIARSTFLFTCACASMCHEPFDSAFVQACAFSVAFPRPAMVVAAQQTPRGKRRLASKTSPSATSSAAGTPGTLLDTLAGTPETDPRGGIESPALDPQVELPEGAVDALENNTGDACEKLRLSKAWYNKFAYWKKAQVRACGNAEANKKIPGELGHKGHDLEAEVSSAAEVFGFDSV